MHLYGSHLIFFSAHWTLFGITSGMCPLRIIELNLFFLLLSLATLAYTETNSSAPDKIRLDSKEEKKTKYKSVKTIGKLQV